MPMLFDPGVCCDCGSSGDICQTITVAYCGGHLRGSGITVTAKRTSDGTVLDSADTDASSKVTLCIPSGVSNIVEIDGGDHFGVQTFSGINSVVATRTLTLALIGAGVDYCCDNSETSCSGGLYFFPSTLYLSDANGTWSPDHSFCGNLAYSTPVGSVPSLYSEVAGVCTLSPGGGTIEYRYDIGIVASGPNIGYRVTRSYGVYLDGTPAASLTECASRVSSSTGYFGRSGTCPDIYLSGSLTPDTTDPDPVGGTVVLSS